MIIFILTKQVRGVSGNQQDKNQTQTIINHKKLKQQTITHQKTINLSRSIVQW